MSGQLYPKILILTVLSGWVLLFSSCFKDPDNLTIGKFIDNRDQHEYKWVTIGTQTWMAENLAWMPAVSPPEIGSDTVAHYYVYGYVGANVAEAEQSDGFSTYGVFYNWPAALNGADSSNSIPSGVRGICPEDWHLPSDGEWYVLINYLGGEYTAGKKMKSTRGWNSYEGINGKGDNSSGFNGLSAGARKNEGGFYVLGNNALFWSSTGYNGYSAWYRHLTNTHLGVYRYFLSKRYGFSVRCIKDIKSQ